MFSFSLFRVCLLLSCIDFVVSRSPKRGLAFAEPDHPADIFKINHTSSAVSWVYNWASSPPSYLADSGFTFIPMQWGTENVKTFVSTVTGARVQSLVKTVLGFNEPDFASQSNLSPVEAARLWKRHIQPLKASGYRLGAPAVTSALGGRVWLVQFLEACSGCTIEYIPMHWYGQGLGPFYSYLWAFHLQFPQYRLAVTEFADTSSDEKVVEDFMKASIKYMDELDWIERYAWFGFFRLPTIVCWMPMVI